MNKHEITVICLFSFTNVLFPWEYQFLPNIFLFRCHFHLYARIWVEFK